jgi:hypothetical protein
MHKIGIHALTRLKPYYRDFFGKCNGQKPQKTRFFKVQTVKTALKRGFNPFFRKKRVLATTRDENKQQSALVKAGAL